MHASCCLPHLPPPSSASWLSTLKQPCCLLTTNQQIVPSLRACSNSIVSIHAQPSLLSTAGILPAPAAAAYLVSAAAATAAASGGFTTADADDVNTTRARLYSLYDFIAQHQRLPEVQDTHQGVAVGQWAEKCRQLQQQEGLEHDLAAALQSIPGWSWQPRVAALSDSFQDSLQQLAQYAQRHGAPPMRAPRRTSSGSSSSSSRRGSQGPSSSDMDAAYKLCKQLVEQRKRGVLTQQQIDAIAIEVPGWRWDNRIRAPPLDGVIQLLQAFHEQHGHLPRAYERLDDGFLIGEWCMARRGEYSRGQLEVDVADTLESQVPGWLWNRLDNVFEKNLEALAAFVAANGRTPTQRETWEGVRVGAWSNKRRLQYKAGSLAADRVAALEGIPGWWWSCDQMPDVDE